MKINWKVRLRNPVFWIQILGSIGMTAMAYGSITAEELNTWPAVWKQFTALINNPYLIGLCLWQAGSIINDPTTVGLKDSEIVLQKCKAIKEEI